ncbi:MAG: peptidoglycan editing factor PgeF [Bacteroidota bacterium]
MIEWLEPELWQDSKEVRAGFTLKNTEQVNSNSSTIPGLNTGFHTQADREEVQANRERLFADLKLDPEWTAWGEQVHSNRVRFVTSGGTYSETDGLVTRVPGLTLMIQVADCAVVLLADEFARVVGALHAGWRGAAGQIVPLGIQRMMEHGAQPDRMTAYISPCICEHHFEVGPEVADQFPEMVINRSDYQKPHINLKAYLEFQLINEGLATDHIEVAEGCTMGDATEFYSYRREGERSGRMVGFIQLSSHSKHG